MPEVTLHTIKDGYVAPVVEFRTIEVPDEERRKGDYIMTQSGRVFWPIDARPDDIDLEDIAHGLSHVCRYVGQTRKFYSVAQHAVMGSLALDHDPDLAFKFLHHDDTEAYLVDVPTPLKRAPGMEQYLVYEQALMEVIWTHFGIDPADIEQTREMDLLMLHTEMRDIMPAVSVKPDRYEIGMLLRKVYRWPSWLAKKLYLWRHKQLKGELSAWKSWLLRKTLLRPIPVEDRITWNAAPPAPAKVVDTTPPVMATVSE